MSLALLWIPVTLAAALTQTARNATQRSLTATIGVVGATQVRFLYGFPFALLLLLLVSLGHGQLPPRPDGGALLWVILGALGQIVATGLMLAAMQHRSFAVAIAYTKTEPLQVAIFAAIVIGDPLSPAKFLAILVATAGVILISWRKDAGNAGLDAPAGSGPWFPRAALLGIASGTFFAVSAIGFRGAILALDQDVGFLLRATTILAWGLGTQTVVLVVYLMIANPKALFDSFPVWRPSLKAGALGALASQFWFVGFALTSAANVRTLALIEVLLAQIVSRKLFSEGQTGREKLGMALVVAGVAGILWLSI